MADPYLHKYKAKAIGSSVSPALASRVSIWSSSSRRYQLRSLPSTHFFVLQKKVEVILAKAFDSIHGATINAKGNRKKALGDGARWPSFDLKECSSGMPFCDIDFSLSKFWIQVYKLPFD